MRRRKRPVGPIYTFLLIYLAYALFLPLLRLSTVLIGLGLSTAAALGVAAMLKRKLREVEEAPIFTAFTEESAKEAAKEDKEGGEKKETRYSPQVNAIIDEGRLAMKEMGRLYASIRNENVRKKINEIMAVSDKIVRDAIEDESDEPQIRKFLDYYLPTTIKLLNAYDRMDELDFEGENISGSKQNIEEMLDTTIEAYTRQLDALFRNQAMDIDAEIRAMNSMMAQEGIGGKGTLDWNTFKKEYDKQKGTVQNG